MPDQADAEAPAAVLSPARGFGADLASLEVRANPGGWLPRDRPHRGPQQVGFSVS